MYLKFKKLVLMPFGTLCGLYLALTNKQGLILNDAISLSTNGATMFYWSVALVGLIMTFFYYRAEFSRRQVARSGGPAVNTVASATHDG